MVDAFCEEAKKRRVTVVRDVDELRPGDRISEFMAKLGQADRIFIFISDKYLWSPYCMFELFEIWRSSRQNKILFLEHVRVYTVDGVRITTAVNRLIYTKFWKEERDAVQQAINDVTWEEAGEEAIREYFRMKTFAGQVSDILALFADAIQVQTFEDLFKYGFENRTRSSPQYR